MNKIWSISFFSFNEQLSLIETWTRKRESQFENGSSRILNTETVDEKERESHTHTKKGGNKEQKNQMDGVSFLNLWGIIIIKREFIFIFCYSFKMGAIRGSRINILLFRFLYSKNAFPLTAPPSPLNYIYIGWIVVQTADEIRSFYRFV